MSIMLAASRSVNLSRLFREALRVKGFRKTHKNMKTVVCPYWRRTKKGLGMSALDGNPRKG